MHISQATIKNYRSFKENTIRFNPGLNIIIGHNNAGKTNLLNALQHVFDRTRQKPTIDDFNGNYNDYSTPPAIEVSVILTESIAVDGCSAIAENPEDKNLVYEWLLNEQSPYQACLTYRFFLPFKHHDEYTREVNLLRNDDGTYKVQECRKLIDKKFLRKYVAVIYGGDSQKEEKAGTESLDRFDFQFLDAVRDAERQMFYGNNTLLRDVLNYFLDYDLTEGQDFEGLPEDKRQALKSREIEFANKSSDLLEHLIGRISKQEILAYSNATGADKGGHPDFDGEISEQHLLFALRLIVEKLGFKLPIKNNGLGYNNLLFIALILAKMQMERSSFMGDNAKVFPILAIEEPEAHLHPSMQYKFLRFLDHNVYTQRQARQAFITTHSTQITAAVNLDSIICLYEDIEGLQRVGYPGRVFTESLEDQTSKAYVRRFLDATKSNILFADRIVFVEGLAEQLLLPCFAAYLDAEDLLVNAHTAIVSVDSTSFSHFLKLFAFKDGQNSPCLHRRVVCITDADPSRKETQDEDDDHKRTWKSCYPFELDLESTAYHYKPMATHAVKLQQFVADFPHIRVFTPTSGIGKTLEYELAHHNPSCLMLLTDSFPKKGKSKKELINQMMIALRERKEFEELISICLHEDIKSSLTSSTWEVEQKKKALIAACYHRAIESSKGEHAFLLEQQLRNNLLIKPEEREPFEIPNYIAESIKFITN